MILLYALSKSKKSISIPIIILSLIFIIFGPGLVNWFDTLGIDSFIEARSFDKNDALFFLTTVPSIMFPDNYKVLLVLLIIWFLFYEIFEIGAKPFLLIETYKLLILTVLSKQIFKIRKFI